MGCDSPKISRPHPSGLVLNRSRARSGSRLSVRSWTGNSLPVNMQTSHTATSAASHTTLPRNINHTEELSATLSIRKKIKTLPKQELLIIMSYTMYDKLFITKLSLKRSHILHFSLNISPIICISLLFFKKLKQKSYCFIIINHAIKVRQ